MQDMKQILIIHTAALKNIEITEYNPIDTIDVNVNGTINLIKSVIKNKPEIFINISTDKVAEIFYTIWQYKTIRRTSNKLGLALIFLQQNLQLFVWENIIETRGNVFEVWKDQVENNQPLTIYRPKNE